MKRSRRGADLKGLRLTLERAKSWSEFLIGKVVATRVLASSSPTRRNSINHFLIKFLRLFAASIEEKYFRQYDRTWPTPIIHFTVWWNCVEIKETFTSSFHAISYATVRFHREIKESSNIGKYWLDTWAARKFYLSSSSNYPRRETCAVGMEMKGELIPRTLSLRFDSLLNVPDLRQLIALI